MTQSTGKRIALIGSHPESIMLAPYGDTSWTIWPCSPGAAWKVPRADAFYELHFFNPDDPNDPVCSREYLDKIVSLNCPVWAIEPIPGVPSSRRYPKEEMVAKYGGYFFTSSLAWMFAMALEQNPAEIGLWGVDMVAAEEYREQRPSCHHFIQIARDRGIKVTVPPQSDLLQPPQLYGYGAASPMAQKILARRTEIARRKAEAEHTFEQDRANHFWYRGDLERLVTLMPDLKPEKLPDAEKLKAELERKVTETTALIDVRKGEFLFLTGVLDDIDYFARTWLPHDPPEAYRNPEHADTKLHLVAEAG